VSFALTAPVAALIGVRATLFVAAAVGSTATLAALFIPGMRDIEGDAATPPRPTRGPSVPPVSVYGET
jgi:hypothetical protein